MSQQEILFNMAYYQELKRRLQNDPFPFEGIDFSLSGLEDDILQQLWLYHVNGYAFQQAFVQGKRVIATTGFGLTGAPHVGTIAQILRAIRLQRAGIPVQIVLGDLDAYNGKGVDLQQVRSWVKQFRDFILALGFDDTSPSVIRTQYDDLEVLRVMYLAGNYLTDEMFNHAKEDVHDYYHQQGKIDDSMTYRIKLSLNLMVADFLGLHVVHGYDAVLVFLGVDEYKYVRLAMETLANMQQDQNSIFAGMTLSGLYSRVIKGLYGHPKMGKSLEGSGIDVDMSLEEVTQHLIDGEGEYRNPEESVVFQMISSTSLYSGDEILQARDLCQQGGEAWAQAKRAYAQHLHEILSKWPKQS